MSVHPVIARIVRQAYAKGHGSLHLQSLDAVRRHYQQHFIAPQGLQSGQDHHIKGCLIRLHRPPILTHKPLPLIIYLRASGYSVGSINDADYYCQCLAKASNCIVAALEPRLAPEYKFPIPIQDCIDGLHFLQAEHRLLKINPRKMALWGDSSGGTYVAALSQLLKQDRIIRHQVLFYPMLDYFNDYPSKSLYQTGYLLDKSLCDWFIGNLCNTLADVIDARLSPILADDFSGLPPTTLVGAQYDIMRDESMRYVQKLIAANVPVNATYYAGMIHGFLWYSRLLDAPNIAIKHALEQVLSTFDD